LVKAKLRLVSSALTATIANPFISIFEDILALVATAMAFLAPFFVFAVAVAASAFGFRLWWRRKNRSR
jgi:hypothetical protein